MNLTRSLSFLFLFFCAIACENNKPKSPVAETDPNELAAPTPPVALDTFEKGKVISSVICKNDATQSYALYLPLRTSVTSLPVVYFFDPHGDGSLPLNKYKSLAEAYGFILIGSNNSKNGNDWSASESIWNQLSGDTRARLKIDAGRIYACGFSGGAKVATYVGLSHPEVRAVIANGAGLPEMINAKFNFSFTAVAGEGDMNMTDLVGINDALNKTNTRHRLILFDGKHEWAPEATMHMAFAGLQLDAMRGNLTPNDKDFIDKIVNESKKKIVAYSASANYVKAEQSCTLAISMLEGLTSDLKWFKEKDIALKNDPGYQRQLQSRQSLLVTEQRLKASYEQQFQQGDINYWTKTITDLQANAKINTAEGAMYQRLIAYLSLAFYSITNQLISTNRNKEAQYFVELYKMDDPSNTEAWYLSAVLNARNNNAKATEDDLAEAISRGFADRNRALQQPEFKTLAIDIPGILNKIK